ncbi:hypothetical protein ACFFNY_34045 [Paenibacillus hodogayensis]|uniref:LysM domain-containing protein n=1 Tax=Paenibacillus hodogayensis TaxID=279208 RepID=A0ABV5W7T0_9BACL
MKRLKTIVAGTMTLALTLGGGLWAHYYASAASADNQTQTQQKDKSGKPFGGKRGEGTGPMGEGFKGGHGGLGFGSADELATLLGTTKDELNTALQSGKTLAAIAGERGVAVDSIVSLLTKAQTEQIDKQLANGKLTQEQADKRKTEVNEKATKFVNEDLKGGLKGPGRDGMGEGFKGGFPGGHGGLGFGSADELATLLGTTKDELNTALQSGKTLAAIAGEKGVSVDSVVSLLTKAQTEQIDKQLADGKLTQEQADKHKTELKEKATKFVNEDLKGGLKGPGRDGMGESFKGGFPGGRGGLGIGSSDELATLLGTTKDELNTALQSGKTLAAIAGEKGVSVDSVVSLLTKAHTEQIDKQLADGKLTQEQADKHKTELKEKATKFVNEDLRGGLKGPGKEGFPKGDKNGRGGKNAAGDQSGTGSEKQTRASSATVTS